MFSHSLFSIPFALVAVLWVNNGLPEVRLFLLILVCLFAGRNGANAINRVIDARFDKENPRTKDRHIPKGEISKISAFILSVVLFCIFIISAYFINRLSFYLSFFAVFLFVIYSYTKRFTWLSHNILGIIASGSVVGAWIAVTGKLEIFPFFMAMGMALWIAGFDVLYATQDIEFDKTQGLFSIPSYFGLKKSLIISNIFHITAWMIFVISGFIQSVGILYYIGMVIIGILLIVEHWDVNPKHKRIMNFKSYHINQVLSIVFFVFSILDFFLGW